MRGGLTAPRSAHEPLCSRSDRNLLLLPGSCMTHASQDAPGRTASPKKLTRPTSRGWIELATFLSDPLTYLPKIAKKDGGDLVPFLLGSLPCTLVTKPEYIKQGLLNEDWPPITRGRLVNLTKWYLGGLFVNMGAEHHRQRDDIWKPILADPIVPKLAAELTEDWAGKWKEGQTFDIFRELRALCFTIDWKAMTGEDLRNDPKLLNALEIGVNTLPWLILPMGLTRWNLPLPATLAAKGAQKLINDRVTERIAERRRDPSKQDLLAKMVAIRDAKGSVTTDAQLNSTVMMYFGADQLHAMYAWLFYLLSQNPDVEAKLQAELDRELGGRTPVPEDMHKLPYLHNVLKESMRIMPPVWGFFRELTQDYQMGDTLLPSGSLMGFSPWVTQRDERYWPEPLRFNPDRWATGAKMPPALSYFPFSAGPYRCHGTELAMTEAFLMLTIIAQRWSFRPTSSAVPVPTATWCTEPKGGIGMKVTARKK
ncbi:MAG: cytochrome P450 [bacterium]